MYYDDVLAMFGMDAKEVFLNFNDDGRCVTIQMFEDDTSAPETFGRCEVQHGGIINWNMANGDVFKFDFVVDFSNSALPD